MSRDAEPRIPPYNLHAERSLLGACLTTGSVIEDLARFITPGDFYDPWHAQIWTMALLLWRSGQPVDPITVTEALCTPVSEVAATVGKLVALQADTPSIGNAVRYGEIVVRAASARALLLVAGDLAEAAYQPGTDPVAVSERIRAALADISRPLFTGPPSGYYPDVIDFLETPDDTAPWVVPGIARGGMRTIIVAPPGIGKSTILRTIWILAAAGQHPFFPSVETHAVNTLYVDLENPGYVIRLQSERLARAVMGRTTGNRSLFHRDGGLDLTKRADRSDLEAAIRAARPDIVLMGPLYKLASPQTGQNYDQAAAVVVQILDDLRTRYGFALCLEHHTTKSRDMFAGAVTWERWPEVGILLKPTDEEDLTKPIEVARYRPDRIPTAWPGELHRATGGTYWWVGRWDNANDRVPDDYARPDGTAPARTREF